MALLTFTDGQITVSLDRTRRGNFVIAPPSGPGPVTQSVELATSVAATDLQALNRLFDRARRRNDPATGRVRDRTVARVFCTYSLYDSGTPAYRTEILDGRVSPIDKLSEYQPGVMPITRLGITWQHMPWWESDTLVEVPLTNGRGTDVTGGLQVDNHTSGSASSYFRITNAGSAVIAGDLPAPARIEIANTYNNVNDAGIVHLGELPGEIAPASQLVLQAEDATGGSTQSSGTASGGQYKDFSLLISEPLILTWSLSGSVLDVMAGRRVKPLLSLAYVTSYTDLQFRWRLAFGGGLTTLYETNWVTAQQGSELIEGESIPIPTRYLGGGSIAHELQLYGRRLSSTNAVFGVDFVQLVPAVPYRKYVPYGYNLPYQWTLVDDGIEDDFYVTSSSGRSGHYQPRGRRIELIPNRPHGFGLIHQSGTGDASIDRTFSVRMFYRPRKATL